VLLVVLCGVWFRVLPRCSFSSYWKIDFSQLQIQSMIWASTLYIRKHGYFSGLDFIILFVGILPFYAINLDVVSLLADSPFTYLTMFVYDVQSIWMNEYRFVFVKKNRPCLKNSKISWWILWCSNHAYKIKERNLTREYMFT